MSQGWPLVPLSKIAKPISRPVTVQPGKSYRTIGVKWWGEGAYERETIDGSQTAARTLSYVRADDLIINKIWVRNGSTAVATSAVDGCAASGEFPTFLLDSEKVIPRWVHWLTKTEQFWNQCDRLSKGTSGKNRIKPELFLSIEAPLPPLTEQGRLVARIDELAGKVEEAKKLRDGITKEAGALKASALRSLFSSLPEEGSTLQGACTAIIDCLHSNPIYADEGVPTVRSPDVGWGRLNLGTALKTNEAEYLRRTSRGEPTAGDIVVVREGGGTGKAAIVEPGQRFSLGQRVMMLRPNREKVEPKYLLYHWLSPLVYEDQITGRMKGSASPHLNIGAAQSFYIRLPELSQQRRIVGYLDSLMERSDELQQKQAEVANEISAVIPAILNRAFTGNL